jgi:hypothetical protein
MFGSLKRSITFALPIAQSIFEKPSEAMIDGLKRKK